MAAGPSPRRAGRTLWLAVALMALSCSAPAQRGARAEMRVFSEQSVGAVCDTLAVVPTGSFAAGAVPELARRHLTGRDGPCRVVRLLLAESELEVSRALGHGAMHGDAFGDGPRDAAREWADIGPVARLLAVGEDALLSVRAGRRLTETLLRGSRRPDVLRLGESTFRLLHVSLYAPPQGVRVGPFATFYLTAQPAVRLPDVRLLLGRLRQDTRLDDVRVRVRGNAWFLEDPDFPAVFPFLPAEPPPSRVALLAAPRASCQLEGTRVTCSGKDMQVEE